MALVRPVVTVVGFLTIAWLVGQLIGWEFRLIPTLLASIVLTVVLNAGQALFRSRD